MSGGEIPNTYHMVQKYAMVREVPWGKGLERRSSVSRVRKGTNERSLATMNDHEPMTKSVGYLLKETTGICIDMDPLPLTGCRVRPIPFLG